MSPEEKNAFYLSYLTAGTLKGAFKLMRKSMTFFYRSHDREMDKDPEYKSHINYLCTLISRRKHIRSIIRDNKKAIERIKTIKKQNEFDEDKFIEVLQVERTIKAACRAMNISTTTYHRHNRATASFSDRVAEIVDEIRQDNTHYRHKRKKAAFHTNWTPPNQSLIQYPRWR